MKRFQEALNARAPLLSVYLTAGFPEVDDTIRIAAALERGGVDMLEIGMPFSDPVADGPVIQAASQRALENGMTVALLLEQLRELRQEVSVPVFLMGYWNPVMQFGFERFIDRCAGCGIDGLILPDLPLERFEMEVRHRLEDAGLAFGAMVAPSTRLERVREIDEVVNGFLYAVTTAGVTGSTRELSAAPLDHLRRLAELNLRNPLIAGFGVHDRESFRTATQYTSGAIVGSAFLRAIMEQGSSDEEISRFVRSIRPAARG